MESKVIEKVHRKFSDDRAHTLSCISTLATTYRLQGNLKAAAELGKSALDKESPSWGQITTVPFSVAGTWLLCINYRDGILRCGIC